MAEKMLGAYLKGRTLDVHELSLRQEKKWTEVPAWYESAHALRILMDIFSAPRDGYLSSAPFAYIAMFHPAGGTPVDAYIPATLDSFKSMLAQVRDRVASGTFVYPEGFTSDERVAFAVCMNASAGARPEQRSKHERASKYEVAFVTLVALLEDVIGLSNADVVQVFSMREYSKTYPVTVGSVAGLLNRTFASHAKPWERGSKVEVDREIAQTVAAAVEAYFPTLTVEEFAEKLRELFGDTCDSKILIFLRMYRRALASQPPRG
jgi:hypothetical protein